MKANFHSREKITKQFIDLASKLSANFPDLDLRFNLQGNTNKIRYTVPTVSSKVFELTLGRSNVDKLVYEATFEIKELTQRFDA